uniref:Uncharacterized protein n=1 Tax=Setaria viridis TaxID=4556 RepID=A0A4U6VEC5_SETVI|nr:hypothetical protein SEVIR_4G226501v2 [Setaria viridis]
MKTCIVGNRYLRKAFVRMIGSCCLYHHEHTMIVTRGNGLCVSLPETNAVTRRRRKERVGRERLVIIIRVAAVGASDSEGTSESGGGCGAGGGTPTGWGKLTSDHATGLYIRPFPGDSPPAPQNCWIVHSLFLDLQSS